MLADLIKVHCLAHGVTFPMSRTSRIVVCKEGDAPHPLSDNFPNDGSWVYCCNCQTFIAWDVARSDELGVSVKECPFCLSSLNPRLYTCDHCAVTMVDYDDQTLRKQHTVLDWGMPQPACPGCHKFPRATPRKHACVALQCDLATARASCPFCGMTTSAGNGAQPGAQETAPKFDRALAEAQAQAADAEERIRLAEAAARKEIALRVQAERKAEEIERRATRELSHLPPLAAESQRARAEAEAEHARAEAEAHARQEAEQKAREAEARRVAAERASQAEAERRAAAERRATELAEQYAAQAPPPFGADRWLAPNPRNTRRDGVTIALYAALAGVLFITLVLLIITLLRAANS